MTDAALARLDALRFDNSYARLPATFHSPARIVTRKDLRLALVSPELAARFGLEPDDLGAPAALRRLNGEEDWPGAAPLAMAYAGHQFGTFVVLGDGRALLLGEVIDDEGRRWDWHLKGSGPTAYSRGFDGKAALRSTLRELLACEARAALGIPTTRALAMYVHGDPVFREVVEPGALLIRLADSHLRFGHFELQAARRQPEAVAALLDYAVARHYPSLQDPAGRAGDFLQACARRCARLCADWEAVGFVHGVLNTDNTSIAGITLDDGPFAFLDDFNPDFVGNTTDRTGRYTYARQREVFRWNLRRLADALGGLLSGEALEAALEAYAAELEAAALRRWRAKLGLAQQHPGDEALIAGLIAALTAARPDFTAFFRALCELEVEGACDEAALARLGVGCAGAERMRAWLAQYRARLRAEGSQDEDRARRMRAVNPRLVLRQAFAQAAIAQAEDGDWSEAERLLAALRQPFDEPAEDDGYGAPPDRYKNFRLSCSS